MKKPNLREQFELETGHTAEEWSFNRKELTPEYAEWIETINSEMIDALVEAHGLIRQVEERFEHSLATDAMIAQIEKALKKAGCTE